MRQTKYVACAYCGNVSHTDIGLCISCGGPLSKGHKLTAMQAENKPKSVFAFLSGWPAVLVRILCAGFFELMLFGGIGAFIDEDWGAYSLMIAAVFVLLVLMPLYPFHYWRKNRGGKPYPGPGLVLPVLGILGNGFGYLYIFALSDNSAELQAANPVFPLMMTGIIVLSAVFYALLLVVRLVRLPTVLRAQKLPMRQALGEEPIPSAGPAVQAGIVCAYCGTKWEAGTAVCPGCGWHLPQPEEPAGVAPGPAPKAKRRSVFDNKWAVGFMDFLAFLWLFICGALVVAGLSNLNGYNIGFGIVFALPFLAYVYYRRKSEKKK